jgi:predicted O-methyltransferase YrrM
MSITTFLNSRGFSSFEGHSQQIPQQVQDLVDLTSAPNIKVMEIGFNAGHSAEIILKNNENLTLTSFDLGSHSYVTTAKEYIDETFPNRHTLYFGDSRKSIPSYIKNNKGVKFDVIFIDGGHCYDISRADMENCFHLSHKDTIVIMDDTIYTKGWEKNHTIGPTRVWTEFLQQKKVLELARKEYCDGRGMSWGKYVF